MDTIGGRVVAVTGGARGIGAAITRAFTGAGAVVAVGDIDGTPSLDVRDERSYAAFLERVTSEHGPVDVLVNNAGVAVPGPMLTADAGALALQIEVNLLAVVRGMRLVLPGMVARGRGHVVNLASAAGRIPAPGAAVYSASKHAVVALTDAVRFELLGTGVALTSVLPGVVRTQMSAGLRMRGLPTVDPDQVARAVLRAVGRRRPPATVMVPRWLRVLSTVDNISPQWIRDAARRFASVAPQDNPDRAAYDARVARQLERG